MGTCQRKASHAIKVTGLSSAQALHMKLMSAFCNCDAEAQLAQHVAAFWYQQLLYKLFGMVSLSNLQGQSCQVACTIQAQVRVEIPMHDAYALFNAVAFVAWQP